MRGKLCALDVSALFLHMECRPDNGLCSALCGGVSLTIRQQKQSRPRRPGTYYSCAPRPDCRRCCALVGTCTNTVSLLGRVPTVPTCLARWKLLLPCLACIAGAVPVARECNDTREGSRKEERGKGVYKPFPHPFLHSSDNLSPCSGKACKDCVERLNQLFLFFLKIEPTRNHLAQVLSRAHTGHPGHGRTRLQGNDDEEDGEALLRPDVLGQGQPDGQVQVDQGEPRLLHGTGSPSPKGYATEDGEGHFSS